MLDRKDVEGFGQEIALLRLIIRETFMKDDFYACVRATGMLARVLVEQARAERPARRSGGGRLHTTEFSPEFERMLMELAEEE